MAPADEVVLTGLINAERRAEGVRKVVSHTDLVRAGRKKSMKMASGGRFAHSGGLIFADGRAGAQNIAMAPSAIDAFRAMLASPGHRRNMMSKEYRMTGVGAARDCDGMVFFTINLVASPPK
jgi:uncharacterized protein YkwD